MQKFQQWFNADCEMWCGGACGGISSALSKIKLKLIVDNYAGDVNVDGRACSVFWHWDNWQPY